ncbi:hypothetical protein [Streptomyces sp. NPDC048341]
MPMKQGETYTCPCDTCDCTIQVLVSAPADCPGTAPTCCCGKVMVKSES